jgi:hypothetical protein
VATGALTRQWGGSILVESADDLRSVIGSVTGKMNDYGANSKPMALRNVLHRDIRYVSYPSGGSSV